MAAWSSAVAYIGGSEVTYSKSSYILWLLPDAHAHELIVIFLQTDTSGLRCTGPRLMRLEVRRVTGKTTVHAERACHMN